LKVVTKFERRIAEFFGAPYAVAVDSCTHGLELCLRLKKADYINVPKRTYLSVPFLANKLGIELKWRECDEWLHPYGNREYYSIYWNIFDAAVLWRKNSYLKGSFMCLSFQYQKHLSLGRGGMILCDNEQDAIQLKKMSYDGRLPNIPWRDQNIDTVGYHYYCTPETAQLGLDKLLLAIATKPRQWRTTDWPDLTTMKVFQ